MSRISIEIDDELIAAAMAKFTVWTKREAVDIALRRAVGTPWSTNVLQAGGQREGERPGTPLSTEFLLSLQGIGWDGDLDGMRGSRVDLTEDSEPDLPDS